MIKIGEFIIEAIFIHFCTIHFIFEDFCWFNFQFSNKNGIWSRMGIQELKKIVIIGPESTGKSTLCEKLAQQYNTLWCPEYAREYLLTHGLEYRYEDLLRIAKGQVEKEEEFMHLAGNQFSFAAEAKTDSGFLQNQSPLLFIDTDMYVMKVWCEFVFGDCHQWIIDQIAVRTYDLYLLCNTDMPWQEDELREYPDLERREKLYHIYRDLMVNQSVPWVEISGDRNERFNAAMTAVDRIILPGSEK